MAKKANSERLTFALMKTACTRGGRRLHAVRARADELMEIQGIGTLAGVDVPEIAHEIAEVSEFLEAAICPIVGSPRRLGIPVPQTLPVVGIVFPLVARRFWWVSLSRVLGMAPLPFDLLRLLLELTRKWAPGDLSSLFFDLKMSDEAPAAFIVWSSAGWRLGAPRTAGEVDLILDLLVEHGLSFPVRLPGGRSLEEWADEKQLPLLAEALRRRNPRT